jgi:hypothetical protein
VSKPLRAEQTTSLRYNIKPSSTCSAGTAASAVRAMFEIVVVWSNCLTGERTDKPARMCEILVAS